MVDANTVAAPADPGLIRRFEGFLAQDARELEIADAELRHVVNLLVASQEENAALRAELAAANDAVLELLQDLEIAQSGRDTSNGAGGSVRGVR